MNESVHTDGKCFVFRGREDGLRRAYHIVFNCPIQETWLLEVGIASLSLFYILGIWDSAGKSWGRLWEEALMGSLREGWFWVSREERWSISPPNTKYVCLKAATKTAQNGVFLCHRKQNGGRSWALPYISFPFNSRQVSLKKRKHDFFYYCIFTQNQEYSLLKSLISLRHYNFSTYAYDIKADWPKKKAYSDNSATKT